MLFKFVWICELLENLQKVRSEHSTTNVKVQNPGQLIITSWFSKYDSKIRRTGPSAIALLSALFPERRVDRVYNIQEKRLSTIFGRALGLGHSRAQELNKWALQDGNDFGACIERVMAQCEFALPDAGNEVMIEDVDEVLHQLAANSPFSSPPIRMRANDVSAFELLAPILRRLQSWEAKWLTRMILKSYHAVQIPEHFTQSQFHFMLPDLLAIQNSFEAATSTLAKTSIVALPSRPSKRYEDLLRPLVGRDISPQLGVMIQRQPYYKARSIKHCCIMAGQKHMSVERKYDGEYCQIHIDLSKGHNNIQIFSKSGRDSTADRVGLHGRVRDCLRLGKSDCPVIQKCIIEGEVLVWSSTKKCILPFHKIRKYVTHGGRRLGTLKDSPARSDEHLMIAIFDVLLLDDKLLLHEPHSVRRHYLKSLIRPIEGKCILGQRYLVDFSSEESPKNLRKLFASSIVERWEGLVLKACEGAYFSWQEKNHCIKLKKDYITRLGESADLCIIGGRLNPKAVCELGVDQLRWNSFYVGCLLNKDDVHRYNMKPRFVILDILTHHGIPTADMLDLNSLGQFVATTFDYSIPEFDVELNRAGLKEPSELFREPFIVEIMGSGFDKPSNCSFFTLRFPRKTDGKIKLHGDRSIASTTSFQELQDMASRSLERCNDDALREDEEWIRRLLLAEGRSQSTRATSELTTPQKSFTDTVHRGFPGQYNRSTTTPPIFIRADTVELVDGHSTHNTAMTGAPAHELEKPSSQTSRRSDDSYKRGLKRAREVLRDLKHSSPNKKHCGIPDSYIAQYSTPLATPHTTSPRAQCQHTSLAEPSRTQEYGFSSGYEQLRGTGVHSQASRFKNDKGTSDQEVKTSAIQTPPSTSIVGCTRESCSASVSHPQLAQIPKHQEPILINTDIRSHISTPVCTAPELNAIPSAKKAFTKVKAIYIPTPVSSQISASLHAQLGPQDQSLVYSDIDSFIATINSAHEPSMVLLDFTRYDQTQKHLDHLFKRCLAMSYPEGTLLFNALDATKWFSGLVTVWDYSIISGTWLRVISEKGLKHERQHMHNPKPTLELQIDEESRKLFGGVLKIHRKSMQKGSMRYFLKDDWSWICS